MKIKIEGIKQRYPIKLQQVAKWLDSQPDGKVYTTSKLTEILNISIQYLNAGAHQFLKDYCDSNTGMHLWGNKKTIKYLRDKDGILTGS